MNRKAVVTYVLVASGLSGAIAIRAQTIVGSAHDFSSLGWNWNEICAPCHTPHNALGSMIPLWNHASTTNTFTLYSSPTLNATMGQPSSSSKACLSCHDGTVALDSFGGSQGSQYISDGSRLGTDLSNDHPISFTYDAALASTDGGLFNPVTTDSGLGGSIDTDLLLAHKMECSSCHDVHNQSGQAFLLVMANTGSALCLTCHNK